MIRTRKTDVGLLAGKVAIVTGAGRGVGRGEALELAAQGARVVVNDVGSAVDGRAGGEVRVADEVVDAIRRRGGDAVANYEDVADWVGAERIVRAAVDSFGQLDVLVNNAGILREIPIVGLTEDDWDSVIRVHLRGSVAMLHHAALYWKRECERGAPRRASVINTTSRNGISVGLPNCSAYASAKAGIAALTQAAALELAEYGVRVNAIHPSAYTRMMIGGSHKETDEFAAFDPRDPGNNAPMVAWLASDQAVHVTGHVFWLRGGLIAQMLPWSVGRTVETEGRWDCTAIGDAVNADIFGSKLSLRDVRSWVTGTL
jgi:NAD(P)-dependent dehydrogenase (short-subunit alcohol dehydrogenase family)